MLQVSNLSKTYGAKQALNNFSFTAPAGEVIAVIGPNGAGKSTLFNILARVVQPSAGTATLNGELLREIAASRIGFLPEHPFSFKSFTPLQMIRFDESMRSLPEQSTTRDELIRAYKIDEFAHKKMRSLSQGMGKRVLMACALNGLPELIILDEPFNGLDIQSVITTKDWIHRAAAAGSTVLISSHILDVLPQLAQHFIFINEGGIAEETHGALANPEAVYQELFMP
jgi:ABC-2 type transport system ATP-binding protein